MNEKRRRFKYRPRTADQVNRRATQASRDYASPIRADIVTWTPDAGDHYIRILPPTWEDPADFGYDVYVHYGIGPDEEAFVCPKEQFKRTCPVCEERARIPRTPENEERLRDLSPKKRVMTWIIDRDREKEGPMVWSMPVTVNRAINKLVIDKRTGEVLPIDDPEEGYDISFSREGQQLRTKYEAIQIDHRPSPLHDDPDLVDRWLDIIVENPIPDLLVEYSYEHIDAVFSGGAAPPDQIAKAADATMDEPGGFEPEPGEVDDDPPFDPADDATVEDEDDVFEKQPVVDDPPPAQARRRARRDDADDDAPAPRARRQARRDDADDDAPAPRTRTRASVNAARDRLRNHSRR